MNKTEMQFSDTEDTNLKQFLSGSRIYSMLAAAIIAAIVFIPTFAAMLGVYSNASKAKNVKELSEIDLASDLDGQYVTGSAYKFLTKIGYIAANEAAATEYYYLMYLDSPEEVQIATLVRADKRGDPDIQSIINAYLSYAQNPEGGYKGNIVKIDGRFKKLTDEEKSMLSQAMNKFSLTNDPALGYSLVILEKLPTAKDTIPYWLVAFPFGAAMTVCAGLFVYGLILEDKREKAKRSPYPYQNQKKK